MPELPRDVRCVMCDAPMLSFEYPEHLRVCVLIDAERGKRAETFARIAQERRELDARVAEASTGAPDRPRGRRFGL